MVVAIVIAHLWTVLLLVILGSARRTIRIRTALTALGTGVYACAPVVVLLEVAWSRPFAWISGMPVQQIMTLSGYTVDPFIEQIVTSAAVAMLFMVPVIRGEWAITDGVIIAGAIGSGQRLAEDLFRWGSAAGVAVSTSNGWHIRAGLMGQFYVPDLWTTVTSWFPQGVWFISGSDIDSLDSLFAWGTLCGLAVAMLMTNGKGRQSSTRFIALGLIAYTAVDHAITNAPLNSWPRNSSIFAIQQFLRSLAPVIALTAAWFLDRDRQRASAGEPLLVMETQVHPRIRGTVAAAWCDLPSSLLRVYDFTRMRRAYNTARNTTDKALRRHVVGLQALKSRIDSQDVSGKEHTVRPQQWLRALVASLKRRRTLIPIVLLIPTLMWFVIGGWPETAAIQQFMAGSSGRPVLLAWSAITQVYLALRLFRLVAQWREAVTSAAEQAAQSTLTVLCAAGACGFGLFGLLRVAGPGSGLLAAAILHTQQAVSQSTPAGNLALSNSAAPIAAGMTGSTADGAPFSSIGSEPISSPNTFDPNGYSDIERARIIANDRPLPPEEIGQAIPGMVFGAEEGVVKIAGAVGPQLLRGAGKLAANELKHAASDAAKHMVGTAVGEGASIGGEHAMEAAGEFLHPEPLGDSWPDDIPDATAPSPNVEAPSGSLEGSQ